MRNSPLDCRANGPVSTFANACPKHPDFYFAGKCPACAPPTLRAALKLAGISDNAYRHRRKAGLSETQALALVSNPRASLWDR